MTSFNGDGPKDLVPYTGVPAVPPPPPPKNFTFEFKNLVEGFDVQRKEFEALQVEWQKRDRPVAELPRPEDIEDNQLQYYVSVSVLAKRLLERLQALWPEENIHHHASHDGIAMRLGLMRDRLPKGEETDAKSLIERIEAELPSIMALESACHELEDGKEKFPLPRDILPVLQKQKKIWARRMEVVDVERIEKLSNEYTAGRQEQHATVEKALRERLALAGHKELLAHLDVNLDERVDGCLHYVAATANLLRENCTELAEKLQQSLEKYQRIFNDGGSGFEAEDEVQQLYNDAGRLLEEKRRERENEEWRRESEERERQQEQQRRENLDLLIRKKRWEQEQQLEDERNDALARAVDEHWEQIALSEMDAEAVRLTKEQRVERRRDKLLRDVQAMQEELRMELKEQREEVFLMRDRTWDDLVEMIPLMIERLDEQEKNMRELQDRIGALE